VDTAWQFTSRDSLRAALEYADGRYDAFRFQQFLPGAFVPSAQSRCSAVPAGAPAPTFNIHCTGQQLTRLPKLIGQLAYSHLFALPNGTRFYSAAIAAPKIFGICAAFKF
jgi:iron complex outermembrane receptor protein